MLNDHWLDILKDKYIKGKRIDIIADNYDYNTKEIKEIIREGIKELIGIYEKKG